MHVRTALIALAVVATARVAAAQVPTSVPAPQPQASAPAPSAQNAEGRTLAGHTFIPSAVVPGALVTTSFGSFLLLAVGSASGTLQVGDRTFDGTYHYAGVGALLGYEYGFGEHVSARFTIDESMYSGIDGPSAITVGTKFQAGGSLGATVSFQPVDSLRVGVLLDAGTTPGLALTIGLGIKSLIDRCNAGDCTVGDTDKILGLNNVTYAKPALAVNWAPWKPLGITANLAWEYASQKRNDGDFTGSATFMGIAADLDLRHLWGVPIGLQLVGTYATAFSGTNIGGVAQVGGGIFYTGRENLSLGLQAVARRFKIQPDLDFTWGGNLATIGLRYFW